MEALLFPGQGSQDSGMHRLARRRCPELIEQATAVLGEDPFERMDAGTLYLQPAVYCGGLAHWREVGEPRVEFVAGHSLGELAALVAAGYLTPGEGMRLVLERAAWMQRAAERGEAGGLLAVIGPRERALGLAAQHQLTLAADNEPEQVVFSGPVARLTAARAQARAHGVRAVRLRVAAALHSNAMLPALAPFRRALAGAELGEPRMVAIANVTAAPFADVVDELALGVVSSVRWRESVLAMHASGVRAYREMGDSGVLTGLVERTLTAA